MVAISLTKSEINLRRLLEQCEHLAAKAQKNGGRLEWRVGKFVEHLQKQLEEVQHTASKSEEDNIRSYKRRIDFLKGIVKADEENSKESRWRMDQSLLPSAIPYHSPSQKQLETLNYSSDTSFNLQLHTKGRIQKETRSALLGDDTVRKRKLDSDYDKSTEENIDDILKHHQEVQEKLAEEMIKMAQTLKHTSMAASDIIKEDKKTLTRSTSLAESNKEKLRRENERLMEMNKRKCSWWIWIMLVIVCVVFFMMILFIKFVPKRVR